MGSDGGPLYLIQSVKSSDTDWCNLSYLMALKGGNFRQGSQQ